MDQWQYNMMVVDMATVGSQVGFARPSISKMWEVRGPDGLTDWDRLQNMGREGWEMVSSFPVAGGNGNTMQVVFVFRRQAPTAPQQPQQQPAQQGFSMPPQP